MANIGRLNRNWVFGFIHNRHPITTVNAKCNRNKSGIYNYVYLFIYVLCASSVVWLWIRSTKITQYVLDATSGPYVFTINAQVFARALSRSLNILNIYYFYDSILCTALRVCSGAHGRRAPHIRHAVPTYYIAAICMRTFHTHRWLSQRWGEKSRFCFLIVISTVNPPYEYASHVF